MGERQMDGFGDGGPLRIRVYVYTAVNGYSWQGCDGALAESLRSCLGSSWKDRASDGATLLGGIRRGEVGGLNGTAVYRVHVRRNGDFAGRDSDYVALAFIPFAQIGGRLVDYPRLWGHRLLSAPLGTGEDLEGLEIDLEGEGLISNSAGGGDDGDGAYWIGDRTPVDSLSGETGEALSRLGAAFQSRKTELGSFSATVFDDGNGRVSVHSRYRPFPSVREESDARREYEAACRGGGDAARADAFRRWGAAVNALMALTDSRDGQFRHFLGLCQYAGEETEALGANLGGLEPRRAVARRLDCAERVLGAVESHLTGEEAGIIGVLREIAASLGPAVDMVHDGDDLRRRLRSLEERIAMLKGESEGVAKWLERQNRAAGESGQDAPPPRRASRSLLSLSESLRTARMEAGGASRRRTPGRSLLDNAGWWKWAVLSLLVAIVSCMACFSALKTLGWQKPIGKRAAQREKAELGLEIAERFLKTAEADGKWKGTEIARPLDETAKDLRRIIGEKGDGDLKRRLGDLEKGIERLKPDQGKAKGFSFWRKGGNGASGK